MKIVDAIAEILKREGVEFLSAYPTTSVIDATAAAGIRSVLCRQERVGVGIADGFTRVNNGRTPGVFAMQYGPGAENAFAGVATAYSASTPILLLPLGHQRDRAQVFPLFSSAKAYESVTKNVETLNQPDQVSEVMRRAFNLLKNGRPGPVMVEIPADVAGIDVNDAVVNAYRPVTTTRSAGNARDVDAALRVLLSARKPIILAGQGVLNAEATSDLVELAELLGIPVMTTLEGKSGFPEDHPLALGVGSGSMPRTVYAFLKDADVVLGIGTSFTKHGMATNIPAGKTLIHATNDERDLHKNYYTDHPILGDAKLVLRQFVEAARDALGKGKRRESTAADEIKRIRAEWLAEWTPKL